MDSLLEIKDLSKIYHDLNSETLAINNINLKIYPNEIVSIVGPSGCGKTTLLSILANLESKSSGNIIFNKDNLKMGYMLQKDALLPWKTILDNCLIGLDINNKLNESKMRVIELLNKYGLGEFIDKYPDSLSGGMRQRVALIRTLALDPDILLLDEAFSALDYVTRLTLSDDVYKIIKNEGKTAIIVTHDIAEAISLSDRVVVLSKRPSSVKKIYDINLVNKSTPINNRKSSNFNTYYDEIWRDLDVYL